MIKKKVKFFSIFNFFQKDSSSKYVLPTIFQVFITINKGLGPCPPPPLSRQLRYNIPLTACGCHHKRFYVLICCCGFGWWLLVGSYNNWNNIFFKHFKIGRIINKWYLPNVIQYRKVHYHDKWQLLKLYFGTDVANATRKKVDTWVLSSATSEFPLLWTQGRKLNILQ